MSETDNQPVKSLTGFPVVRPRRLRRHPLLRGLVRETSLSPADFVLPLFVRPGRGTRQEIRSMPGQFQLSPDRLVDEVGAARVRWVFGHLSYSEFR